MSFSVVAIISAHNEADIIEQVVGDLVEQGIGIYFLDDGSTDGTVRKVEPYRNCGVLGIERLCETFKDAVPGRFEWGRILSRKAQLAKELDADWFIHHDADEFRESLWPGLTLNAAIQRVDALGFNAIDFALFNFWPVHDSAGDDVRKAFTFYSSAAPYDRLQIRCWKKTDDAVDLVSSGGHEARFPGRRVFPLRFIVRHYPIRGQAHGERKVRERRARFLEQERADGWHVQYDDVQQGGSFVRDPSTLTPYDPEAVRLALTLRPRGVDELEEALGDLRSEAEAVRRDLTVSTEELARTRKALDARSTEADGLREELAHRVDDIHEFRRRLDAGAAEIESLRAAVAEGLRRLDELHHSLSWRWTSPVRAAYRVLTGEGRRQP